MENKLIIFIKKLWTETIVPVIRSSWEKSSSNTDKIVNAIEDKDIDPSSISDPIVEAQNATTEAVKAIPVVSIPELDVSGLEGKLEALLVALKEKEMVVNVGKTEVKVDNDKVVKAIQKIKLEVPKMEKVEMIDYTLMLDEMMKILERPKDHSEIKKVQELLRPLSKTEDMAVIAEYLQKLIDKPQAEFPEFEFNKEGRLKVEVDKVGGGGGGSSVTVDNLYKTGFSIPPYDTEVIDESGAPATTVITYSKNGSTVATKTITVSGTTTTISVT